MNTDSQYNVVVLFSGYSKDTERGHLANCTCSLIKGPKNIIVDTLTAWDGEKLIEALKRENLSCEDIDYVVCTHAHSDHVGCNYLFPRAIHIVGFNISHGDVYFRHDFASKKEYEIDPFIQVLPTPGHTMQSISVVVKTVNKGFIGIVGDLFESENDLDPENLNKRMGSESKELQLLNRKKIIGLADWIIPGHGPMFKVKEVEINT